ncbi:hypothetical protein GKODMF_04540 [Candidatus Electrothrix gigas]
MNFDDQKEFNLVGTWWVPGRDQPEHPGILRFSPEERPTLELPHYMGFLTKPENNTYTDQSFSEFFPVVCGRTELGPVTLLSMQYGGGADFVISDARFDSPKPPRFREIRLQFQNFPKWLGQEVIKHTIVTTGNGNGTEEYVWKYRALPMEKFSTDKLSCQIFSGLQTKGKQDGALSLHPKVFLKISSSTSKTVHEWWRNIILPLRDLFSLAMNRPIEITQFDVIDDREAKYFLKAKRVFFKGRKMAHGDRQIHTFDMLFTQNDIAGNDIGKLFNNWLNLYKESTGLSVLCNLYSSATSTKEQYLEEEFINFAHAAELYHRARFNSSVFPKTEWKKKINNILGKIPDADEKQWLKEKLCWSNSPTLQNRLEELLETLEPTTSLLVGDKKEFAETVKHTRNYFTHWDTKGKKKAAFYPQLYFVTTTLRYLIAACLLRELGFSSEETAKLFDRNIRINNFRLGSDNSVSKRPGGEMFRITTSS